MKTQSDNPEYEDSGTTARVLVFDTTLRDGEQAPGFSLDRRAKLRMAQMLEALGVDILEAGFPKASPDDFTAVAEVAGALKETTVCALARCVPGDIESAARALESAQHSRIHLFLSTSPLHREYKLGMDCSRVLATAVQAVERARSLCEDVEFSAEDATRTEWEFLVEVFSAAAEAGATTLNVPDTVGYTTPAEMAELFRYLRAHVPGAEKLVFSGHCHDDLGLAVANSLAAIGAGARQVECTVNGIGERAGNAALEEIVMALKVRAKYYNVATHINTHQLCPASRLLAELTGHTVPWNKAVVGANAFAHESGIHQHGMLKHPGTYEIMRPEDVGLDATKLVLGKHSGRAALRARLAALGYALDDAAVGGLFARFKALADTQREIDDDDLEALACGRDPAAAGPWRLTRLDTSAHLGAGASASVKLHHEDGREVAEAALGEGPIEAVLRAIERATGVALPLTRFKVEAQSAGGDAQGEAHLTAHRAGHDWNGHAVSADLIEAAAEAAIAIVNRMVQRIPGTIALTHTSTAQTMGVSA